MMFWAFGLLTTAHAGPATDATQRLIEDFKTVRRAPEGGTLSTADKAANDATFARIDRAVDLATLIQNVLAPHRAKLTDAQRQEIETRFRDVLRRFAYPEGGKAFHDKTYATEERPVTEGRVDVVSLVDTGDDLEIEVALHWHQRDAQWLLKDMSLDGDSLMLDYRNQFGRILDKEGADGLLQRIRDKQDELEGKTADGA